MKNKNCQKNKKWKNLESKDLAGNDAKILFPFPNDLENNAQKIKIKSKNGVYLTN